jgi:hypothetical protein
LPSATAETTDHEIDQRCVSHIEQALEPFAPPEHPEVQASTQCLCDSVYRHDRDPSELATLNPRDDASRHCCPIGDVLLAPAAAATKGLEASAEADRIHRAKRMTARVQH